ncbi:hypothetical protein ABZV67_40670 [Streptomyces sp. NPDC005065]|uniref:hypothetical protein n=1 Tax=Streptomyces sp. NPDC005065 TaxID=3154461 RepID=UPI0033A2209E
MRRSATTAATTSPSSGTVQGPALGRLGPLHPPAGAGTWDGQHGERLRVTVTLATGIPEEVVRGANLDHLAPSEVDIEAFSADPDTLVVPQAGEVLFRLR